MRMAIYCAAALMVSLGSTGCGKISSDSPTTDQPKKSVSAATATPEQLKMRDTITYGLAIYLPPASSGDPVSELQRLLRGEFNMFAQVDRIDGEITKPVVAAHLETDLRNYRPPDLESLRYFGRGLTQKEAEELQVAEKALLFTFAYSKEHVWSGLESSHRLIHRLATDLKGLIWDGATREMFTPQAWEERRLANWNGGVPNISRHFTIHAYQNDEYVRAITLGMEKVGLPDIVIEDFSWSLNRNIGITLDLFAQAMTEGTAMQLPGDFDLNIREIKNSDVREPQVTGFKENATGILLLTLKPGTHEEGDPSNELIEIGFDRGVGPDLQARQEDVVSRAFGWEERTVLTEHDDAVLAASRKARAQLPALKAAFTRGLPPGEFVLLKAPFEVPSGGNEWMWVEVTAWEEGQIRGSLQNEPSYIPDLHAGQNVVVSEADVFDYIHRKADGTSEGNETSKFIERNAE